MESTPLGGCVGLFLKNFFSNFRSHIKDSKWGRKYILMNYICCNGSPQKSHFSLQMGNYPIPVAQNSGQSHLKNCLASKSPKEEKSPLRYAGEIFVASLLHIQHMLWAIYFQQIMMTKKIFFVHQKIICVWVIGTYISLQIPYLDNSKRSYLTVTFFGAQA